MEKRLCWCLLLLLPTVCQCCPLLVLLLLWMAPSNLVSCRVVLCWSTLQALLPPAAPHQAKAVRGWTQPDRRQRA